jgi:ABC-type spermidine/putrescine transport system permease subunit II
MLPGLLIGVMLLLWFASIGAPLSLFTVVCAQTLYVMPYTVLVLRARLADVDLSLEEAARDLGSTRIGALLRITIPIIAPALIGAAVLAFALSLDEFVITFFVIGNQSTLPMMVWSMLRTITLTPEVNAISTLLMVATTSLILAALGLYALGGARRERR